MNRSKFEAKVRTLAAYHAPITEHQEQLIAETIAAAEQWVIAELEALQNRAVQNASGSATEPMRVNVDVIDDWIEDRINQLKEASK